MDVDPKPPSLPSEPSSLPPPPSFLPSKPSFLPSAPASTASNLPPQPLPISTSVLPPSSVVPAPPTRPPPPPPPPEYPSDILAPSPLSPSEGLERGFSLGLDPQKRELKESWILSRKEEKGEDELQGGHVELRKQLDGKYLYKEGKAGRCLGRKSKEEVEKIVGGPFLTSPFGVVFRPGKDPRHVRNLSKPYPKTPAAARCPAVNSRFPSFDLLPPTKWAAPEEVGAELAALPPASPDDPILSLGDDGNHAFRLVKIDPEDWRFTVMQHEGGFYVDYRLPMGLKSATDIWGSLADYEDRSGDQVEEEEARKIVDEYYAELGMEMSPKKRGEWTERKVFQGVQFRNDTREVALPEEKRIKGLVKIRHTLSLPKLTGDDLSSSVGYLSHLAFVVQEGRFHLSQLFLLQAPFVDKPHLRLPYTNKPALSSSGGANALANAAVVVGAYELVFPLKPNWRDEASNIHVPEGIAVELARLSLFELFDVENVSLTIECDNETVVACWENKRSNDARLNRVLERIYFLLRQRRCFLDMTSKTAPYFSPQKPISKPTLSPFSLDYSPPSDLIANQEGHVFPSILNGICLNSKEMPASERLFHHTIPPIPSSSFVPGEPTFSKNEPNEDELKKKMRRKDITQLDDGSLQGRLPWDKTHLWQGRSFALTSYEIPLKDIFFQHIQHNSITNNDFLFTYLAGQGKKKGERVFLTKSS
ncbi:hypothetical protein JCM8547_005712 [Rhodosporidiobolus lusitaniae]